MKDTVTKDEYNFRTEVGKGYKLVEWEDSTIEGDEYSHNSFDWLPIKPSGQTPKYWFCVQECSPFSLPAFWAFRRKVQINETE